MLPGISEPASLRFVLPFFFLCLTAPWFPASLNPFFPSCLFVCLSAYLPLCMSVCLHAYLPVCLLVSLSACQRVSVSACLLVCLSACLLVCLSACLLVCMSACLLPCFFDFISMSLVVLNTFCLHYTLPCPLSPSLL
jgi:hypothetical protein